MRCDEIDELVQRLLDDRQPLESDRVLQRHAHECRRCRALLAAYGDLWDGLELAAPAPLDDGFAVRVVAQWQPTRPAPAASRWSHWTALALAASWLITVSLVWRSLGTSEAAGPRPSAPLVEPSRLATQDPGAAAPARSPAVPRPGGPSTLALRQPPLESLFGQLTERLTQESFPAVDGLTDGFRPVRESLGTALDVLRTAFPLKLNSDTKSSSGDSAFAALATPQPA